MRSLCFVFLLQPANGGPPRFPTMASINASAPIALSFNPSNATALGSPFVPIGTEKGVPSELPWCIVESEDRPRADDRKGTSSYWQAAADRNERYARCHGYGFAYIEHTGGRHGKGCSHSVRGYLLVQNTSGSMCFKTASTDVGATVSSSLIPMSNRQLLDEPRRAS